MYRIASSLLLFATMHLPGGSLQAAVVYNESIDGDAPSGPGAIVVGADVGTLNPGINEFVGQLPFDFNSTGLDFDDYIFTVPYGSTLERVEFELGSGEILSIDASLYLADTDPGTLLGSDTGASSLFFEAILPVGPGQYRIDHNVNSVPFFTDSGNGPYVWRLTLVSVPEPSAILLWMVVCAFAIRSSLPRRMRR